MKKTFISTLAVYSLTICTSTIAGEIKASKNPEPKTHSAPMGTTIDTPIDKPAPIAPQKPIAPIPITVAPPIPQGSEWIKIDNTAISPQALAKRSYYAMPADATCIANNDPNRTKLKTWRNKISFNHKGQMLIWESICNDSPRLIPWTELTDAVLITADLTHINYTGQIFIYFNIPPLLCATGSWCPAN